MIAFLEKIDYFSNKIYCSTNIDLLDMFIEDKELIFISSPISNILSYTFKDCFSLLSANFPLCTTIGMSAFDYCSSLLSANFPLCTIIGSFAFYSCSSLLSANFPECTTIGNWAFTNCFSLLSANFPLCTTIGMSAFDYCSSLLSISFPLCASIGHGAFLSCTSLQSANFPLCTTIGMSAFYNCTSLQSVYLLASSVCTLVSSNAFSYTPIRNSSYLGYFGSIYVPSSLIDAYKSATNWKYFSNRITVFEG